MGERVLHMIVEEPKFLSIRNMVLMRGGRSLALTTSSVMQKAAKDATTPRM
jgi:hypothetical protein